MIHLLALALLLVVAKLVVCNLLVDFLVRQQRVLKRLEAVQLLGHQHLWRLGLSTWIPLSLLRLQRFKLGAPALLSRLWMVVHMRAVKLLREWADCVLR
jgi:hypothetical protein